MSKVNRFVCDLCGSKAETSEGRPAEWIEAELRIVDIYSNHYDVCGSCAGRVIPDGSDVTLRNVHEGEKQVFKKAFEHSFPTSPPPSSDPEAPYGRKKDGTPKKRQGRQPGCVKTGGRQRKIIEPTAAQLAIVQKGLS